MKKLILLLFIPLVSLGQTIDILRDLNAPNTSFKKEILNDKELKFTGDHESEFIEIKVVDISETRGKQEDKVDFDKRLNKNFQEKVKLNCSNPVVGLEFSKSEIDDEIKSSLNKDILFCYKKSIIGSEVDLIMAQFYSLNYGYTIISTSYKLNNASSNLRNIINQIVITENEVNQFQKKIDLGYDLMEQRKFKAALNEFNNAFEIYHRKVRNQFRIDQEKNVYTSNKFPNPINAYYGRAMVRNILGDILGACKDARRCRIFGIEDDSEYDLVSDFCKISEFVSKIDILPKYSIDSIDKSDDLSNEKKLALFYVNQALNLLKEISIDSAHEDFRKINDHIDKALEMWDNEYFVYLGGLVYEIEYLVTGSPGALAYSSRQYEKSADMGSEMAQKKLNRPR
tara:strand:- start:403 stop:1596 length:1194 start_codon:yes stop_codon:yes gene_type:complete